MHPHELKRIASILANQTYVRCWLNWGSTGMEPGKETAISVWTHDAETMIDITREIGYKGFVRRGEYDGNPLNSCPSLYSDALRCAGFGAALDAGPLFFQQAADKGRKAVITAHGPIMEIRRDGNRHVFDLAPLRASPWSFLRCYVRIHFSTPFLL